MKKNDLYKIIKPVLSSGKVLSGTLSCMLILLVCQDGQAQAANNEVFVNVGKMSVSGDILSTYFDFENLSLDGSDPVFINDGDFQVYANWYNSGVVNFSTVGPDGKTAFTSFGKTSFLGEGKQNIIDRKNSSFQDVLFQSYSDELVPFNLSGIITVNNKAMFQQGIIDADSNDGRMVFNQNASHSLASDNSFVDGIVKKIGSSQFEFPVGDDLYFRPNYYVTTASERGDAYTSQYFYQATPNADGATNDNGISSINSKEYWEVKRENGQDNITLSLSLDSNTTPSEFLNPPTGKEVVIVRWDAASNKWINEKGAVSIAEQKGAGYSKLLMAKVSGYGIFTMALATSTVVDDIIVYNAVSPNGDGVNDTFHLAGIKNFPDNTVEVYNRWGVRVFETKGYDESDNVFAGYSDGRVTIKRGEKLPTGTYFYIIRYNNGQKGVEKSGYLYINNQ